jgi:hypothetical protein
MRFRTLLVTVIGVAVVAAPLTVSAISSAAPDRTSRALGGNKLYGALAGSNATSDLYKIDPATGATSSVGPIGYAVTGMAFVNGVLYGVTSNNSVSPRNLITIDPNTGAGTIVGPLGCGPVADIASKNGKLWGWCESGDDLVTINTATGAATVVADSGLDTYGDAMSFDQTGTLYAAFRALDDDPTVYRVKTSNGQAEAIAKLHGGPFSGRDFARLDAGAYSCDGRKFYAVENKGAPSTATALVTLDPQHGTINGIGLMLAGMDALVWKCQVK